MEKTLKNGSKMKLFFGSLFGGSWGRFWEAFGEDFGGPGRLLGGKMGEKRNKTEESQKIAKRERKKSSSALPRRVTRWPLRPYGLSRRGLGEGRRQKF